MSTLYAGPFGGEFGWEIMGWQANVRKESRKYDRVVVVCRWSSTAMYMDFCNEFFFIDECDGINGVGCEVDTSVVREQIRQRLNKEKDGFGIMEPSLQSEADGEFIRFGHGQKTFRIVFCARCKDSGQNRNWSIQNWQELKTQMPTGMNILSVGKHSSSMWIPGTIDGRGWSLREVMNAMSGADLVIGPNSGLIHLASLCCPKQIVTWVDPRGSAMGKSTYDRVTRFWNPFNVPTHAIKEIHPSVATVANALKGRL